MAFYESGGGTKWNLLASTTGTTHISLPSTFNELYIETGLSTNNLLRFSFNVLRETLSNTTKGFRNGYYANQTAYGIVEIDINLSEVWIRVSELDGQSVISNSPITVYYR